MAITDTLTQKVAGLPGWQWAALVGAGGGLFIVLRRKSAASSSSTGGAATAASPYGPNTGGEVLAPIIIGNGPASTPLAGNSADAATLARQAKQIAAQTATNKRQSTAINKLEHQIPKPAKKPAKKTTGKKAPAKKAVKKPAVKPKPKTPARVAPARTPTRPKTKVAKR